jgi:hypothetical protein
MARRDERRDRLDQGIRQTQSTILPYELQKSYIPSSIRLGNGFDRGMTAQEVVPGKGNAAAEVLFGAVVKQGYQR